MNTRDSMHEIIVSIMASIEDKLTWLFSLVQDDNDVEQVTANSEGEEATIVTGFAGKIFLIFYWLHINW